MKCAADLTSRSPSGFHCYLVESCNVSRLPDDPDSRLPEEDREASFPRSASWLLEP